MSFQLKFYGEIYNFYLKIPFWDIILHIVSGFLCAAIGFSILNKLKLSALRIAIFAICFSMTIAVIWEFFEFGTDKILFTDMQKDSFLNNISTVEFNNKNSNKAISLNDISQTIVYDKIGNKLAILNNGYLDIGLYDTMEDLFVNFLGSLIFAELSFFYILKNKKLNFIENFIPKHKN